MLTAVLGVLALGKVRGENSTNQQPHNMDRIGHVDADYVSGSLPAAKKIAVELQSYEKQLQNQLETEMRRIKELHEAYQKEHKEFSEVERNQKRAEIDKLGATIQQFEQDSSQLAAEKRFELTKPIFDQINQVIKEKAEEKGFSFIFNKNLGGAPVIFYGKEACNITILVLEKLEKNNRISAGSCCDKERSSKKRSSS